MNFGGYYSRLLPRLKKCRENECECNVQQLIYFVKGKYQKMVTTTTMVLRFLHQKTLTWAGGPCRVRTTGHMQWATSILKYHVSKRLSISGISPEVRSLRGNYDIDMQPHQMKQTFTLNYKIKFYLGLNIVQNILDNVNKKRFERRNVTQRTLKCCFISPLSLECTLWEPEWERRAVVMSSFLDTPPHLCSSQQNVLLTHFRNQPWNGHTFPITNSTWIVIILLLLVSTFSNSKEWY